ncbi:MAG: hypothetical protein ACHQ17_14675 [Polyangia bacterium]|jgi:hypothetical protein
MAENTKLHQAWLSVLGVFSSAEQRLMESLGLNPDNPLGVELMARMKKNRDEFERRVDEGVKTAMARVRAPIDKELATLRSRVEKIQTRIEEQKKKRHPSKHKAADK